DFRQDFREKRFPESRKVLVANVLAIPYAPADSDHLHGAVAERHHDKHRLGFALGNQVIHDDVGAADRAPSTGIVAVAVKQVEHRIALLGVRVIARRSVNVVIAIIIRYSRSIEVTMNLAVWHIIQLPWERWRSGHMDHVLVAEEIRLEQMVVRIDAADAI